MPAICFVFCLGVGLVVLVISFAWILIVEIPLAASILGCTIAAFIGAHLLGWINILED